MQNDANFQEEEDPFKEEFQHQSSLEQLTAIKMPPIQRDERYYALDWSEINDRVRLIVAEMTEELITNYSDLV